MSEIHRNEESLMLLHFINQANQEAEASKGPALPLNSNIAALTYSTSLASSIGDACEKDAALLKEIKAKRCESDSSSVSLASKDESREATRKRELSGEAPTNSKKRVRNDAKGTYGCQCETKYPIVIKILNSLSAIHLCKVCDKGVFNIQCLPNKCCDRCKRVGVCSGRICEISLKLRADGRIRKAIEENNPNLLLVTHLFQNLITKFITENPKPHKDTNKERQGFSTYFKKIEGHLPFTLDDLMRMKFQSQ